MSVESAADRLVFLDVAEFGAVAIYTPLDGPAIVGLPGIFDRPSVTVGEASSVADAVNLGFTSTSPTFLCRSADLPADATDGDEIAVTVDGVDVGTFVVRVVEPDGTGMTVLTLEVA